MQVSSMKGVCGDSRVPLSVPGRVGARSLRRQVDAGRDPNDFCRPPPLRRARRHSGADLDQHPGGQARAAGGAGAHLKDGIPGQSLPSRVSSHAIRRGFVAGPAGARRLVCQAHSRSLGITEVVRRRQASGFLPGKQQRGARRARLAGGIGSARTGICPQTQTSNPRRRSFWSSRRWAKTSARRRVPWRISG